jgi:hypothetical protein
MNSTFVKEPAQVQQHCGLGGERSKSSFDLHLYAEAEETIKLTSVGGYGGGAPTLRQQPCCFNGSVNVGKGAGDEARLRGAGRHHLVRDSCQHVYLGRDEDDCEILAKGAQVRLLHQQLATRGNAGNQNLTARTQVGAAREETRVETGRAPEEKCWRAGYGGARAGGHG